MNFKNMVLLITLLFLVNSCCDCKKKKDDDEKQVIPIVGKIDWEDWKKNAGWKDYDAKSYLPDEMKIKKLNNIFKENNNLVFVVFSGNWCSDSEDEVPKFYKLMNQTGFNQDKISLYGVDRNKQEPTGEAVNFKIEKVPTVIILNDDNEVGRIVEFPFISWEDDLLTIFEELK